MIDDDDNEYSSTSMELNNDDTGDTINDDNSSDGHVKESSWPACLNVEDAASIELNNVDAGDTINEDNSLSEEEPLSS